MKKNAHVFWSVVALKYCAWISLHLSFFRSRKQFTIALFSWPETHAALLVLFFIFFFRSQIQIVFLIAWQWRRFRDTVLRISCLLRSWEVTKTSACLAQKITLPFSCPTTHSVHGNQILLHHMDPITAQHDNRYLHSQQQNFLLVNTRNFFYQIKHSRRYSFGKFNWLEDQNFTFFIYVRIWYKKDGMLSFQDCIIPKDSFLSFHWVINCVVFRGSEFNF